MRRRGKPLRNAMFIVKRTEYGTQGRVLLPQEHPFECQTNYGGLAGVRCNFDVQDLRRVLPETEWMAEGDQMPHIGDQPLWGYMNVFEFDGHSYQRRPLIHGAESLSWDDGLFFGLHQC